MPSERGGQFLKPLDVDWRRVYGGWGSDRGLPLLVPQVSFRTATFPVPFVFAGFFQGNETGPTDEPMTPTDDIVSGGNESWQRTRAARQAVRRARHERGPGLYVTNRRSLLAGPVHLAIEYRDKNNEASTLSAFPADILDKLESTPDASADRVP